MFSAWAVTVQLSGRGVGVCVGWSICAAVGVPGVLLLPLLSKAAPLVSPLVMLQEIASAVNAPRIKSVFRFVTCTDPFGDTKNPD